MLEDDYADVIRKALVGRGWLESDLVAQLGIQSQVWQSFLAGDFDKDLAKQVAAVLHLNPEAFAAHPIYHPKSLNVVGVTQLELPFGQWTVNAWWVERGNTRLVFDAGSGPCDLIEDLPSLPQQCFITHGHHDHVGGVEALIEKGVTIRGAEFSGLPRVSVGEVIDCGELKLKVCDLSGHAMPAVGYHIEGLETHVLVVGDSLFAGSMGKTPNPDCYQLALHTLQEALEGLGEDTVLLTGHGPATTVGEERKGNPFLT